jgi:hypothetical protein
MFIVSISNTWSFLGILKLMEILFLQDPHGHVHGQEGPPTLQQEIIIFANVRGQ